MSGEEQIRAPDGRGNAHGSTRNKPEKLPGEWTSPAAGRLDELIDELWRDHRPWIFHLAWAYGAKSNADAQGMVQEAFLRLVRAVRGCGTSLDTIADLKGYFRATLSSVAVDRARKAQRTPVSFKDNPGEAEHGRAPTARSPEALLQRTERRLIDADRLEMVDEAIDRMPRRWQSVIRIRYLSRAEGPAPFSEIAEELGITTDAAKGIHRRAIGWLRDHLRS